MKLSALTIDDDFYEAKFIDEATGVTIKIPLSEDDVAIIEAAMEDVVSRVLEVMKNG